jgi:hypothetical protein
MESRERGDPERRKAKGGRMKIFILPNSSFILSGDSPAAPQL